MDKISEKCALSFFQFFFEILQPLIENLVMVCCGKAELCRILKNQINFYLNISNGCKYC